MAKATIKPTARAGSTIRFGHEALYVVKTAVCTRGDVLGTTGIAPVQAAKQTPILLPACHTLVTEARMAEFEMHEPNESIAVTVAVRSSGKTGVEMEALAATRVACLTVCDMLEFTGKNMAMGPIMLPCKSGGKGGDYQRHD